MGSARCVENDNIGRKCQVEDVAERLWIPSGSSAILTLPDYGRVARDPDTIAKVIGGPHLPLSDYPAKGFLLRAPDGESNLTPKGSGA
jgi:hypothetical protein